jgi:hypothetical protein
MRSCKNVGSDRPIGGGRTFPDIGISGEMVDAAGTFHLMLPSITEQVCVHEPDTPCVQMGSNILRRAGAQIVDHQYRVALPDECIH